jgi:hypothetical protein
MTWRRRLRLALLAAVGLFPAFLKNPSIGPASAIASAAMRASD